MGRIRKTFYLRHNGKRIRGKALVDTGSDKTVIDHQTACAVGFKPAVLSPAELHWGAAGLKGR